MIEPDGATSIVAIACLVLALFLSCCAFVLLGGPVL